MMKPAIKKTVKRVSELYDENTKTHGVGARSVGWHSQKDHALRFEKLCEVIKFNEGGTITVNDLGCGYGALCTYLMDQTEVKIEKYSGYDVSKAMLQLAREELDLGVCSLNLSDSILEEADYSFASGTFNVCFDADRSAWRAHIEASLRNLHHYSRKGMAFNLLSTYVDWKAPDLYYGDPLYFFDFCKRNLSTSVTLIHDYPLYEWTILVGSASNLNDGSHGSVAGGSD